MSNPSNPRNPRNPDDHVFTEVCDVKFKNVEKDVGDIETDVKEHHKLIDILNAIITNGLRDKVSHIEKEVKWILRLLIVTILGVMIELVKGFFK